MQTSHNRATRTFMDYDSISQAMDGIYAQSLKHEALTLVDFHIIFDLSVGKSLFNFLTLQVKIILSFEKNLEDSKPL